MPHIPAWHEPPLPRWFTDDTFQRTFELLLAAPRHGAADAVELLETAARIKDGDADSWVDEWAGAGGYAWTGAHAADARHSVSAREHFLRAATYYGAAAALASRSSEPEREQSLRERQRTCWDRAMHTTAQRLGSVGSFFRAPDARAGELRAAVIVHTAGGPPLDAWIRAGAAAGRRGHHWLYVTPADEDDPTLTHALGVLLTRADVDPRRIAVIALDAAAAQLPFTLAHEHRLAAAVVDPAAPAPHRTVAAIRTPLLACGPQAALLSPVLPRLDGTAPPGAREAEIFDWLALYLDPR
jgi:hypothetical protein